MENAHCRISGRWASTGRHADRAKPSAPRHYTGQLLRPIAIGGCLLPAARLQAVIFVTTCVYAPSSVGVDLGHRMDGDEERALPRKESLPPLPPPLDRQQDEGRAGLAFTGRRKKASATLLWFSHTHTHAPHACAFILNMPGMGREFNRRRRSPHTHGKGKSRQGTGEERRGPFKHCLYFAHAFSQGRLPEERRGGATGCGMEAS